MISTTTPPPAIHSPATSQGGVQDDMPMSCKEGHRHALVLNPDGSYVVHSYPGEKNQPDIVMDGLCHSDDESDAPIETRRVLPVPKN